MEKDKEQMLEHRYEFSPVTEKKSFPKPEILTHARIYNEKAKLFSGYAKFNITAIDHIHVGSGLFELSEDAGFTEGYVLLGIAKRNGDPIIPGSSLKGASRAIYEAVTKSCVAKFNPRVKEKVSSQRTKSQIPQVIVAELLRCGLKGGKVDVRLDRNEPSGAQSCGNIKEKRNLLNICPACALYGGMGFMGRIHFSDAHIIKLASKRPDEKISVESLSSPQMHRVGSVEVVRGNRSPFILIKNVHGRKFYYHSREIKSGSEPIDYIPKGSTLEFRLDFENVTKEELGGIFLSLGMDGSFNFSLGGKKTSGFGRVNIISEEIGYILSNDYFKNYESEYYYPKDLKSFVCDAMKLIEGSEFFYKDGLTAIRKITKKEI